MKLQEASRRELRRMTCGMFLCGALQLLVFLCLSLFGLYPWTYRVLLGTLGGVAVAILSFFLLCVSVERAVDTRDEKLRKRRMQLSYNLRLLLQAGWVVAAFAAPCFHVIAAAVPLLYPTLIIFFLSRRGDLTTPSTRKNPPPAAEDEDEPERLDSFQA